MPRLSKAPSFPIRSFGVRLAARPFGPRGSNSQGEVRARLSSDHAQLCDHNAALNPDFPLEGAMIAQDFEFTGDFPIERNTQVYCRLRKMSCEFKRLARARRLMEIPG